jgi:hypothetical protein
MWYQYIEPVDGQGPPFARVRRTVELLLWQFLHVEQVQLMVEELQLALGVVDELVVGRAHLLLTARVSGTPTHAP